MLSTLEGVRRAGFAVTIMAPPEGPLAEACGARDLALLPFRSCDFDGKRLAQSRRREYLASQIAQFRPDLLHANSLAMARLAGPVAAALDVPCLGHLRDIVKLSGRAVRDLNANTRLAGRLRGDPAVPRRRGRVGREDARALQRRRSGPLSPPAGVRLSASRTGPAAGDAAGRRDRPDRAPQGARRACAGGAAGCRSVAGAALPHRRPSLVSRRPSRGGSRRNCTPPPMPCPAGFTSSAPARTSTGS